MKRRNCLQLFGLSALAGAIPRAFALPDDSAPWRNFELRYDVDVSALPGSGQLWLPLPQDMGDFQRALDLQWQGEADELVLQRDPTYGAPILAAAWQDAQAPRTLQVTARVATRPRHVAESGVQATEGDAAFFLQPTENMPVDGIVAETAAQIVAGVESKDGRARAIYDWIVDNTFREPTTRGCGLGDIKVMLETRNLGGKCADINSLFVGLARAAGIPAREVYGVRVAESAQFSCLGKSGDVSKAQHCRAEYFSPRFGWVAVDPADVRKVVLEEPLPLDDPRVVALRQRLFGFWEMNWVGFNHARDFAPGGAVAEPLRYLMYPYATFGDTVRDGREPDRFQFRLTSRELVA